MVVRYTLPRCVLYSFIPRFARISGFLVYVRVLGSQGWGWRDWKSMLIRANCQVPADQSRATPPMSDPPVLRALASQCLMKCILDGRPRPHTKLPLAETVLGASAGRSVSWPRCGRRLFANGWARVCACPVVMHAPPPVG